MKKITLIITGSCTIFNFRYNLILKLKEEYEVSVIAFDDAMTEKAEKELGIKVYCVNSNNRSTGIVNNLMLVGKLSKLLKRIGPDKVFTFQLKPNTFGVLAARKAGVKEIYSMVEGAGDVFIQKGLKWAMIRKIVCTLYRTAFRNSKKVIFLNKDDRKEFLDRKLVKPNQVELIPGIGVDLEKFAFKPVRNHRTFLMIARMLTTKGVFDYCEVARRVKRKYPDAVFNYLGAEGTVKLADIKEYIDDGSVNYLGVTTDVRPYLEETLLLLLSSYREGMPMSIMEAEAVGRAIITTDSIGCRDSIEDGYNGYILKLHDIDSAVEKVEFFIEHPEEGERMGRNSRELAERKFDQRIINKILAAIIR